MTEVAYVVEYDGGYDDRSEVVFARNPMEARRLGANELDAEEESCTFRRAPEFDGCASHDELRQAQLDAGWWFTCGYCERHVAVGDTYFAGENEDEEYEFEPVLWGDVYCNGWHAGADAVDHVVRRIRSWEGAEAAIERFPGAVIERVNPNTFHHERRNELVATVEFRVPPEFQFVFWWQVGDNSLTMSALAQQEWSGYRHWLKEHRERSEQA